MKIAVALQGVARLFLDTAPVVYFVERSPTYVALVDDIFDRVDKGILEAITSPITLAECLVGPMKQGSTLVQKAFHDLIVSGRNITFSSPGAVETKQAAELRVKYNLGLLDAFQVAIALASGCHAVLTNDRGLIRVQELPILLLDDLEL